MRDVGILLYKGNWECISKLETLLISKNLSTHLFDNRHQRTRFIAEKFGIKLPKSNQGQNYNTGAGGMLWSN